MTEKKSVPVESKIIISLFSADFVGKITNCRGKLKTRFERSMCVVSHKYKGCTITLTFRRGYTYIWILADNNY